MRIAQTAHRCTFPVRSSSGAPVPVIEDYQLSQHTLFSRVGSQECERHAMRRRYSRGLHTTFAALRTDIYGVGHAATVFVVQ